MNESNNLPKDPALSKTAVMGSSDLKKEILKEIKHIKKAIKRPYDKNHEMWLMGKLAAYEIVLIGLA